jgi:ribosome-binding protein aMBF1 (putative translation factor)
MESMNLGQGLERSDTGCSTSGTATQPLSSLTESSKRPALSRKGKYNGRCGENSNLSKTHNSTQMMAMLEEERIKLDIAQQVYDLRESTGLNQAEFAKQVGVETRVIEDLEESDYEGDAFVMLNRIAKAVGRQVEVRIVPLQSQPAVS